MLTVKNLTISLRKGRIERQLVKDISFTLKPGESMGIVGESGSGKTITALSILKLLPPGMRISAGEILLEHSKNQIIDPEFDEAPDPDVNSEGASSITNLANLDEKQIRPYRGRVISMIFQEPMTSLNPSMRCINQISEAVNLHTDLSVPDVKERVRFLLSEVHLPEDPGFYRKHPHQLSGGQRQRIMIAMALAGNPQILIADEPTTALDVTVQKTILELLDEIRQNRQMSMLFISHDLGVIHTICKNALVMYKGNIVESGKVSMLFDKPEHPYTKGLIACRPGKPEPGTGKPERLPTLSDFMEEEKLASSPADPEAGLSDNRSSEQPDSGKEILLESPHDIQSTSPEDQSTVNAGSPMLAVTNLKVRYSLKKNLLGKQVKSFAAVDNISFQIAPGETLGLIGESGCGKSTLGRSLIHLIRSREGNIRYRGTDVSTLKGKELTGFRKKVQFIFQDPYSSLNPRISAGPSIMEVMKVHRIHPGSKERKQATLELLERVGLAAEHFDRYPHEFSGGQRQRIGLARALATGPELIICDESVSSLDVSVQAKILNLLNDLKESLNLTYLFISHDLSVVRYMSDRILVMKEGRLVEQGTGEEIFENPSDDYTRGLIDSIPD